MFYFGAIFEAQSADNEKKSLEYDLTTKSVKFVQQTAFVLPECDSGVCN